VTRDVAGSAFQYAKIMTLPFFGSGIVELPPEGFKRAKNSRKMQMVFFVHQGKVLVTVGPPAIENGGAGNDAETNEFAISKGGVWVVPRGMLLIFSLPFAPHHSNLPARGESHIATLAGISIHPGLGRRAVRQVCQLIF
jgi:centromere protein C